MNCYRLIRSIENDIERYLTKSEKKYVIQYITKYKNKSNDTILKELIEYFEQFD
jgi:hypothetical protein